MYLSLNCQLHINISFNYNANNTPLYISFVISVKANDGRRLTISLFYASQLVVFSIE